MRKFLLQLLSGRDFARNDPLAREMRNFTYLLTDERTGGALVVDPAYDVEGILKAVEENDAHLVGVLATHYHPDHVGGSLFGHFIKGVKDLLEKVDVPIHVNRAEAQWVCEVTGIEQSQLILHDSGDRIEVGDTVIELIHTPGHTPGSQCFLARNLLISGDTLFLEGCGRVDLPGSDPQAMYESLTQKLARLPDDVVLYPGHHYSAAAFGTLGAVKESNYVFRIRSLKDWMRLMGS